MANMAASCQPKLSVQGNYVYINVMDMMDVVEYCQCKVLFNVLHDQCNLTTVLSVDVNTHKSYTWDTFPSLPSFPHDVNMAQDKISAVKNMSCFLHIPASSSFYLATSFLGS